MQNILQDVVSHSTAALISHWRYTSGTLRPVEEPGNDTVSLGLDGDVLPVIKEECLVAVPILVLAPFSATFLWILLASWTLQETSFIRRTTLPKAATV